MRGMSDHFYYALRDENAARDELFAIKFYVDQEESKMMFKKELISAAMIKGEILSFEIDPLCTNDIESIEHENLEECKDIIDKIFIIDSRLNLFKVQIERKCKVLD